MSQQFSRIIPQPEQPAAEILRATQAAQEFYREVRYRENFNNYCQWYYATAEQHQKELQEMRGDINIFGWFLRGFGN
jgi:hypothetical protein